MSIVGAYTGGLAAFFSIWVFCMLQFVPFYAAYVVGASLVGAVPVSTSAKIQNICFTGIPPIAGFLAVFVPMGLPTTAMGKAMFTYVALSNQFGAVLSGLVGLFFIGVLTMKQSPKTFELTRAVAGFFIGSALALAYKPCVTPTLTTIYAISQSPASVGAGAMLLLGYGLGMFTVTFAVSAGLAWATQAVPSDTARLFIRRASGVLLLAFALLVLSGNMTLYKSMLVGGFAPKAGMKHMEHMGGM